jgi:hypothetical protein
VPAPAAAAGAEPGFRYSGPGHRMSIENYQILMSI